MHGINTTQGFDLNPPTTNDTSTKSSVLYYSGIKISNNLPLNIKHLSQDTNKFKLALKKFLQAGSFYSCKEYLTSSDGVSTLTWWGSLKAYVTPRAMLAVA